MDDRYTKRRLLRSALRLLTVVVPLSLAGAAGAAAPGAAAAPDAPNGPHGDAPNGALVYQQHCAQCHDSNAPRIPTRASLKLLPATQIVRTLESGVMKAQGSERTPEERAAVAAFLSAPADGPSSRYGNSDITAYTCKFTHPELDLAATVWNGWGRSVTNDRSQSEHDSGLNAANVSKLHLRWAFGFPDANISAVQPVVVGRYVFTGSASGRMYALDLREGCLYWKFDATQGIRSAVSVGRLRNGELAAFFTDVSANVYSLNAKTGKLNWKQQLTGGRSSGALTLYDGRLYVPLNGDEEGGPAPGRECCKGHGYVAALDAESGKLLWQSSTLKEEPHPAGKDPSGTQLWAPSGAGVWSAPTIDVARHRLYVATANSDSAPASPTSDAILAYDLDSGKMLWVSQTTPDDAWTGGCDRTPQVDCPGGPDFDYGQSPILTTLSNGKSLIVAAQKSGVVYGLDPDAEGRQVWATRVSTGGTMGGSEFGSAVDGTNAYVAISDVLDLVDDHFHSKHPGGLVALRLSDGKQIWRTDVNACAEHEGHIERSPEYKPVVPLYFGCTPAQSAAISVIGGVVFSGSEDGHMRGYAADTGRVLWDVDTARNFYTVNDVAARGGSIDGAGGAVAASGILLTPSGYNKWREMPGNVLLAYDTEPSN